MRKRRRAIIRRPLLILHRYSGEIAAPWLLPGTRLRAAFARLLLRACSEVGVMCEVKPAGLT